MQKKIGTILSDNGISNADIALISPGRLESYSYFAAGKEQPPNSLYLIYSIAKSFIAGLTMRLAEDKQLELDSPLASYFPQTAPLAGVTPRQLLNHTGGIPDYGPLPVYLKALLADPLKPWTFEQYLEITFRENRIETPAGRFSYSNLGYAILKNLIQKTSGMTFDQYLEKTIIKPLKLDHTILLKQAGDLHKILPSMTYSVVPGGNPVDVRYHYHPDWVAHGLLASTAVDVAAFYNALFEGRVVSPQSLKSMLQTVPVRNANHAFPQPAYGLGLMSGEASSGRIYGHTGGGPGFMAVGYHRPGAAPLTIAILTNNEMAFSLEKAMVDIIQMVRD